MCFLGFVILQVSTKEALEGKHVAFYFSSQAVEDQLEKAAQGQEAVRPTPVVKEVSFFPLVPSFVLERMYYIFTAVVIN